MKWDYNFKNQIRKTRINKSNDMCNESKSNMCMPAELSITLFYACISKSNRIGFFFQKIGYKYTNCIGLRCCDSFMQTNQLRRLNAHTLFFYIDVILYAQNSHSDSILFIDTEHEHDLEMKWA